MPRWDIEAEPASPADITGTTSRSISSVVGGDERSPVTETVAVSVSLRDRWVSDVTDQVEKSDALSGPGGDHVAQKPGSL
jgi:hypothetical protein